MFAPLKGAPRRKSYLNDTWLPEYIAIVTSAVFFGVLIVLLAHYDGRPIFDSGVITLNTITSILSNISKGCLLLAVAEALAQWKWIAFSQRRRPLVEFERFNQASRGAMGSIRLLLHPHGMSFAYAGAIVSILAIASDPFVQQLLQYRSALTFGTETASLRNASIARAQRYSKGTEYQLQATNIEVDGTGFRAVQATADFAMQSAILFGLAAQQDDVAQQIRFTCPSSNCRFEDFRSLSVCSGCSDVTASLKQGKAMPDTHPLVTSLALDGEAEFAGTVVNFTLPNGLYIDGIEGWHINDSEGTLMTTLSTGSPEKTLAWQSKPSLFWATSFIRVERDPKNSSNVWPLLPVVAEECALWYCVKQYQTNVINGTIEAGPSEVTSEGRATDSWKPLNRSITNYTNTLEFNNPKSSIKRSDLMMGKGFNLSQNALDSIS